MKRIDSSKLRKGDILLTTSTHPKSKAIQAFTKSDISHAMLYVANGSVMDSTGEGVHARNLQRQIYDDNCAIYAYRAKATIDPETMNQIVDYVRSETGAPYATLDAMRSPLKLDREGSAAQFCSRLVARAYANAGFPLTDNADYTTPADLQRSERLESIPDVVLRVTKEEKAELEAGDTVKGMREVTSDLLKRVRAISPTIRVLNDIPPFLLANPSFDAAIAEAYRASGFLDYWKVEVARHPYRYDPVEIVRLYHSTAQKDELLEYCRTTLEDDAANAFAHWQVNLDACAALLEMKPLETFRLNRDLYANLCFNHERRVKTAHMLVSVHGDLASP
ncbi:hypothetical protein D7Y57_00730 [Stenotrophomonas maltophilia]|nr:hypothetical protein DF40_011885 [Stenotrophomonas maltophilia M30]MBA0454675.1 hypothetical protein [Stenotrophomonas maltophilia]